MSNTNSRNPGLEGTLQNTTTFAEMTDLVRRVFVKTNEMPAKNAGQLIKGKNNFKNGFPTKQSYHKNKAGAID